MTRHYVIATVLWTAPVPYVSMSVCPHFSPCVCLAALIRFDQLHASQARSHEDFLVKLRDLLPQRSAILDAIPVAAAAQGLVVQEATLAEAAEHLALPHLRGNKLLPLALEGDSAA